MSTEDLKSGSNNCSPKCRKSYKESVNMSQNIKKSSKKINDEETKNYVSNNHTSSSDNSEDSSSDLEDDQSDIDETEEPAIDSSLTSFQIPKGPVRSNVEKRATANNVRTPSRSLVSKSTPNEESTINNEAQANLFRLVVFIPVVLAGVMYVFLNMYNNTHISDITYMKQTYPSQPNETWDNIVAVIDDIQRPSAIHPAVFLFLYNAEKKVINQLVHDLATYTSKKLETDRDFIEIQENEFLSEEAISDYGYLIDKYAGEISEKKVMVVKDLQNIPGRVAQAFHTFCDEITPLAESVVYIFTLKVNSLDGKEEAIAEYHLKESWKDLDEDKLMPLVTRVTGSVFKTM